MSDWPRYPIPGGIPGWNNTAEVVTFDVTYDGDTDTVTIVASSPIFSALDGMTWTTDQGTGPLGIGLFTIVNGTTVEIPNAAVEMGPDLLTQLDFYDAGPTLTGIWTGSVDLGALTYPLLQGICSPAADTVRFTGLRFLTATAGAVGYVIPRLADGATTTPLQGSGLIIELANLTNGWVLESHTDTEIELSNPAFTSQEPSLGPGDFNVNGVAFHDAATTNMYYYEPWGEPSPYDSDIDGSGCP